MKLILSSLLIVGLLGCASNEGFDGNANKKKGFGIGAAIGAVAGALVTKDRKKGALIGAVLGGAAGGVYGKKLDDQAQELEKIAETRRTEQGIVTKLKGDITFATGRSAVRPDAREKLTQMAAILKKYPENRITVVGHTDSTGTTTINERLSKARAQAVAKELTAAGVPVSAVKTMGAASSDPIASNDTADGREANRRVELAITMAEPTTKK